MKKNFKKLLGLTAVAAMSMSMLSLPAAAEEESSSAEAAEVSSSDAEEGLKLTQQITYPLTTDIDSVSWYAQDNIIPHEKFKDASESPFHIGLAEKLGVNIDWSFPTTGSDGTTFTNTLLADPDSLPNIMGCYIMNSASQYIDDEIVWDLTDYIQEYAPDYYSYLQDHPACDKAMKDDEGRYYAFGFFREGGGWNDSYQGPVVRTDWLEECGLEIPTTISEFENVIRTFNEKYGATFNAAVSRYKQVGLAGAFGAYGHYNDNSYLWFVKDGEVGYGPAQEEWRDYVAWEHQLWADGLIDQDMLTEDDTTIKDKIHNDKCGISYTSMGQMNNWNKEAEASGKEAVWVGIPNPTADDGTLSCVFGGPGISSATYVITKSADEDTLKLCLEMLNYAYTEEGFLYWNYGTEGESWEYNSEGIPEFTSLVTDDTDTDPMLKYNGATWGSACIQATNLLYLKNSPAAIEANDTWFYNFDDADENALVTGGWRCPAGMTFTTDESDELDEIGDNISTYIQESYASFLNGSKDITDDAVWQQYIDDLSTYGLDRMLEIRQAAYDRYAER